MSALFTPYQLGPVTLRNRTIRSAAFESMGRAFGPTEQLKEYHVAVARGGIGMTTLAYAAVSRSGLSFDKQLWLRPAIVPGLRDITDAVHREGAAAAIQIGHCGNMTHYSTAGQIPIGASSGFNLYAYTPVRGMRRSEIAEVARDFGRAVRTARDAGFDSVEVHAGHGYLISQFLSPYTNRRRDEYGGSLENRMRFMRMCLEEVMEAIGCADQKATKLLNELDSKAGLIERKRQGLGKPNLIFVKNFVDNSTGSLPPAPESRIKTRENHDSADVNFTTPESRKSRGSNTDSNYTDLSETETYPFPSGQVGGHGQVPVDKMGRDMDEREQYRAILEDNLEYDILLENNPYDRDTIAEIMELLLDTICSKRQYIRIAGDDKPREVVKSQFLKLNCTHIEYVLSSFKENASKVRNIKQYLLASLYNAPLTISNYYDALVRHDMANGFV